MSPGPGGLELPPLHQPLEERLTDAPPNPPGGLHRSLAGDTFDPAPSRTTNDLLLTKESERIGCLTAVYKQVGCPPAPSS